MRCHENDTYMCLVFRHGSQPDTCRHRIQLFGQTRHHFELLHHHYIRARNVSDQRPVKYSGQALFEIRSPSTEI